MTITLVIYQRSRTSFGLLEYFNLVTMTICLHHTVRNYQLTARLIRSSFNFIMNY